MQSPPAPPTRRPFRPHVAIDGLCVSERRGGIGEYTLHLTRHLLLRGDVRVTCFCPDDAPSVVGELLETGADVVPVPWSLSRARDQILWENVVLRRRLRRLRPDLFFGPNFAIPFRPGCPTIATLHDFAIDHYPDTKSWQFRRYLSWMIRRALNRADLLLTDSQAVADDLLQRYGPAPDRVRVTPLAPTDSLRPASEDQIREIRQRYDLEQGYVLHVSNFDDRKNVVRLASAFAAVCDELDRPERLVLAGGHPWTANIGKRLRDRGLENRIRFTGYVSALELAALYSGARFFAFPSLYEGFGLPVLEAMLCHTPVLTSDRGALAEVAGSAALLVDPTDASSLRLGIRHLLTDDTACRELRDRGTLRVSEFSWAQCAEATFAAFEAVLRRHHRWPETISIPAVPRSVPGEAPRPVSRPIIRS